MPIARIKDTTFHREVYEPAEDSFLLVDALAAEWRSTLRLRPPRVVVEVGCGTGYVIASAALLAREHEASREARVDDDDAAEATTSTASGRDTTCRFYATDVNRDALAATRATAAAHGVAHLVETCECDLLSAPGLFASLRNATDVLLFNPPYVLTPSEEVTRGGVAAAWAGGVDGREVTDRLLPLVHDVLAPGGTFMLILLEQNKPKEVKAILEERGLECAIVASTSADEERLHVMRARKPLYLK